MSPSDFFFGFTENNLLRGDIRWWNYVRDLQALNITDNGITKSFNLVFFFFSQFNKEYFTGVVSFLVRKTSYRR